MPIYSRMELVREDLMRVRSPGLCFYVLRGDGELHLLDSGFIGGPSLLRSALRKAGWHGLPLRGIVLTHGHLDHILNVSRLVREYGSWVAAPRLDAAHYSGTATYHGWARVTGWLESLGRPLLGFKAFTPDRWIGDGDILDVWHGLRAIALPGHTQGHTGFFSEKLRLLFSADLFATYAGMAYLPAPIFNSVPEQIPGSVVKALSLDLTGVIPNHCNSAPPETQLVMLRELGKRVKKPVT